MKYLPSLRISSISPRPFIPVSSETMDFLATPLSCLGALSGPFLGVFCFLFFPQGFLLSSGPCWVCMWVRSFPRENSLAVHPSYLQGKRSDSWQARICFWKLWSARCLDYYGSFYAVKPRMIAVQVVLLQEWSFTPGLLFEGCHYLEFTMGLHSTFV